MSIIIKCSYEKEVDLIELIPHPRNTNKHSKEQIDLLSKIIKYQGIRHPIIVSNLSGFVVAGHGRLEAARKLGLEKFPIDTQHFKNEAEEYSFLESDNRIAELAEHDRDKMLDNLKEINIDDLELLGIPDLKLPDLDDQIEENTTHEIENPLFTKDQIIANAFDYFRQNGFPYKWEPLFVLMQEMLKLQSLTGDSLIRSNLGYTVADTYHKHRFHSHAFKMKSPVDAFNDDNDLLKALTWHYEQNNKLSYKYLGTMSLVNGTQVASNFRPGFAKYIYEKYAPKNGRVFDTSTGYGGRLTGFIASHCETYIGVDPNTLTHNGNLKLAQEIGPNKDIHLINSPIEDTNIDDLLSLGRVDLCFTSPPYFKKEIYSTEDTQSCNRYTEASSWYINFLEPMLLRQYEMLKDDCYNIVNIEDVKIDGKNTPLVDETIERAKKIGFEFIGKDEFDLGGVRVKNSNSDDPSYETASESVLIFKK